MGAALLVLLLVAGLDLAVGPPPRLLGLVAATPLLVATQAGWRMVLLVGAAAVAEAALLGLGAPGVALLPTAVAVVVIVILTGVGALAGASRVRQASRLAQVSRLVSVAQTAVLRPLVPRVGSLAVASRYISATATATAAIGGDLYEALDTPYGVRVIIGGVRGTGLDAVRLASVVLGSFRHAAYERPDLVAVVADLDRAVSRCVDDEGVVSAALVEERGGTLTVINCGHSAPLLLRRGTVTTVHPPAGAPPLGLMPAPVPTVARLEPGDRLLLYTDALAKARRDGESFPTAERAWRLLGHGTIGDGLASMASALAEWARGPLHDDIALVLIEYAGTEQASTNTAVPSWEVGGY